MFTASTVMLLVGTTTLELPETMVLPSWLITSYDRVTIGFSLYFSVAVNITVSSSQMHTGRLNCRFCDK
jgi:hypothetical protein